MQCRLRTLVRSFVRSQIIMFYVCLSVLIFKKNTIQCVIYKEIDVTDKLDLSTFFELTNGICMEIDTFVFKNRFELLDYSNYRNCSVFMIDFKYQIWSLFDRGTQFVQSFSLYFMQRRCKKNAVIQTEQVLKSGVIMHLIQHRKEYVIVKHAIVENSTDDGALSIIYRVKTSFLCFLTHGKTIFPQKNCWVKNKFFKIYLGEVGS